MTREIGKPADWDEALDGPCASIKIRDEIDVQTGMNVMRTLWKPTSEELDILKGGGLITLGIMGKAHPVIQIGVTP
jgi:hypothetical protein